MSGIIHGNVVGCGSAPLKTVQLIDESGNELLGVVVGEETIFTATDNDVRENIVYAGNNGLSVGTKFIPAYYSNFGKKFVLKNNEAIIYMPKYNYENLMVTISTYDTSLSQSLDVTYISIDNAMYEIGSKTKFADIVIDEENEQIKLGVVVSEKSVLRYSIITEEI